MIVVRVELHSAITGEVTELGRAVIDNIGGSKDVGNYRCRTLRGRTRQSLDDAWLRRTFKRTGEIVGHRRLQLHVWHLVAKALKAMGYGQ